MELQYSRGLIKPHSLNVEPLVSALRDLHQSKLEITPVHQFWIVADPGLIAGCRSRHPPEEAEAPIAGATSSTDLVVRGSRYGPASAARGAGEIAARSQKAGVLWGGYFGTARVSDG